MKRLVLTTLTVLSLTTAAHAATVPGVCSVGSHFRDGNHEQNDTYRDSSYFLNNPDKKGYDVPCNEMRFTRLDTGEMSYTFSVNNDKDSQFTFVVDGSEAAHKQERFPVHRVVLPDTEDFKATMGACALEPHSFGRPGFTCAADVKDYSGQPHTIIVFFQGM